MVDFDVIMEVDKGEFPESMIEESYMECAKIFLENNKSWSGQVKNSPNNRKIRGRQPTAL